MTCLTKAELEAAQEDISDLAAVINGPQSGTPSTVTTRLGTVIKTLARVIYETSIPTGSAIAGLLDTYFGYTTWRQNSREVLTAARTYYVRSDGSDSNNGLADNAGGAFLTLQKAVDTVSILDARTFNVTIQVRDGTFAGCTVKPLFGTGTFSIIGNTTTPTNVIITPVSGRCFYVRFGSRVTISGFELGAGATSGFNIIEGSKVTASAITFGGGTTYGGYVYDKSSLTITGAVRFKAGYATIFYAEDGFLFTYGSVLTFDVGCTCTTYTYATGASRTRQDNSPFTGTLTGKRSNVLQNSILNLSGAGETYLPGTTTSSTSTGGQIL